MIGIEGSDRERCGRCGEHPVGITMYEGKEGWTCPYCGFYNEIDNAPTPQPECTICERPVGGNYVINEVYADGERINRSYYCRENCTPPGTQSADAENIEVEQEPGP